METRRSSSRRSSSSAPRSGPSPSVASTSATSASVPPVSTVPTSCSTPTAATASAAAAVAAATCSTTSNSTPLSASRAVSGVSSGSLAASTSTLRTCKSTSETSLVGDTVPVTPPPACTGTEPASSQGPLTRSRSAAGKRAAPAAESSSRFPRRSILSELHSKRPRNRSTTLARAGSSSAAVPTANRSSGSADRVGMSENSSHSPHRPQAASMDSLRGEQDSPEVSLQGLLRRLGAGLDDIFPSASSSQSRLRNILSVLRGPPGPDSEGARLDALSQLCDYLSVGTEDSMLSFSIDSFVPPLVSLLAEGNSADTMLLAARALTHMMDALPASASAIAHNSAAAPLCANLLTIEYIDLAEQSLAALEKLSVDFPQAVVRAGGFAAALSFIDFFSTGVQRMAALTACNLCRSPPSDAMDKIVDVLPAMMNLLNSEDHRIRESAMLGFLRLADSFRTSSEKLETLNGSGDTKLINRVISLIIPTAPPSLSPPSYSVALRLLSTLSRGSASLSSDLLLAEALVYKIRDILLVDNSPHAIDCLNLADALLPDIQSQHEDPMAVAISAATSSSRFARRRRSGSSSSTAYAAIDTTRRKNIVDDPRPLSAFGTTLMQTFILFHNSAADSAARRTSLSVVTKLLVLTPPEHLKDLLTFVSGEALQTESLQEAVQFAPFVASLLGENCAVSEVLTGLSMVDAVLKKLPEFKTLFVREGVVHELLRLRDAGSNDCASNDASPRDVLDPEPRGSSDTAGQDQGIQRSASIPLPSSPSRTDEGTQRATIAASLDVSVDSGASPTISRVANTASSTGVGIGDRNQTSAVAALVGSVTSARIPQRLSSFRQVCAPDYTMSTVYDVAKCIFEAHFSSGDVENECGDFVLLQLEKICEELNQCSSSEQSLDVDGTLRAFANLIGHGMGISTFELLRSGIVDALVDFLDADGFSDKTRTERTVMFVEALNTHSQNGAFTILVARVLGALASEEKLPVYVSDGGITGPSSVTLSTGLRQLSQPLKLCLRRAPAAEGGVGLRDYSQHIVLIEPLATMASVQEFLCNRVHNSNRDTSTEGGGSANEGALQQDRADGSADNDVSAMVLDVEDDEDLDHHDVDVEDDEISEDNDDDDDDEADDEEEMFELDEEAAHDSGDQDVDDDNQRSDGEYSSGSDDIIDDEDEGEGHHATLEDTAFSAEQLTSSLPAVELDHDDLAESFSLSPSVRSGVASTDGGSAFVEDGDRQGGFETQVQNAIFGSNSRGLDLTNTSASRPRSYAAALASGIRIRVDGSGNPGPDEPVPSRSFAASGGAKLKFTLNGRNVPTDCSILCAVLQSRDGGLSVGPRLWSEVHTLVYSTDEEGPGGASSCADELSNNCAELSSTERGTRRSRRLSSRSTSTSSDRNVPATISRTSASSRPLVITNADDFGHVSPQEILEQPVAFAPKLAIIPDLSSTVHGITRLLKHLHWIYSSMCTADIMGSRKTHASDTSGIVSVSLNLSAPVSFTSQKVTAKLQRQLSDPLALCGGAIPRWCYILARDASFLVPFPTRQLLFQSTALGITRALHLLQLRSDSMSLGTEGVRHGASHRHHTLRESEARIHRIQRQKVRIHRSRVLESAARVMSMYASHSTVLEVEYFDEVGTGLGPTLEFYTLVSRELQRADLGLWRSQEVLKSRVTRSRKVGSNVLSAEASGSRGMSSSRPVRASARPRRRSSAKDDDACSTRRRGKNVADLVEYVVPTGDGLTPSCIPARDTGCSHFAEVLSYFPFIGRLVAKALSDGRLLDLRFSQAFSKLVLSFCSLMLRKGICQGASSPSVLVNDAEDRGSSIVSQLELISDAELWQEFAAGSSGLTLLRGVDPQLASSLQNILDMSASSPESVDSLCLYFVLPENDQIELVAGGKQIAVSGSNSVEYVAAIVRYVLCTGVRRQAEAFIRGFSDVLDATSLLLFQPFELELLICGPSYEEWSREFLVRATRCDHGFRHESSAVVFLLEVLSELDAEDQRRFILFATGSPALPVGGLMGLHPRLTIVKRTPEGGRSPDECLPTVMTCTNYFKLPDYSSYDVTRARLLYALREGQGSFHLS